MENREVILHPESIKYWQGLKRGTLYLQYCTVCKKYQFYPRNICKICKNANVTWKQSEGEGKILSHTTVYKAPIPEFKTPYTLGLIKLTEGVTLLGKIIDSTNVKINQKAKIDFIQTKEEGIIHLRLL